MHNKWKLFEKKEYKTINAVLDSRFKELINAAKIQIEAGEEPIFAGRNIRKNMEKLMDSIDGYGASDTEPRTMLVTLICDELGLPLNQETIDHFSWQSHLN
jgi:hypothetical protein